MRATTINGEAGRPRPRRTAGRKSRAGAAPRRRSHAWRYGFLMAVAMMTVVASAAIGIFFGYVRSLPPIEQLEHYSPPEVTRVYDRTGANIIGEFNKKNERRMVVPLKQIPRNLRKAFIAIEDARFYRHFGVDIWGVARAFMHNYMAGKKREGASTLTMQLAKNIGLADKRKVYGSKIIQAIQAVRIEHRYSKDQILEFYLNQVDFNHDAFGVWAAADRYFSKNLDELTLGECATLAGIVKGTHDYNPIDGYDNAKLRRNVVLKAMFDQRMIKEPEYDHARNEPLIVNTSNRVSSRYPYFLDGLGGDLKNYYGLGDRGLQEKGLRITSTIDPKIQTACWNAIRETLPKIEEMWQTQKPARHAHEIKKWDGKLHPGDIKLMQIAEVEETSVTVRLQDYAGVIPKPQQLPFYNSELCLKKGEWLDVRVGAVDGNTIDGKFAFERPVQCNMVVLDAHTGEVLAMAGDSEKRGDFNFAMRGGRQAGSTFKPFYYAAAFERGHQPNETIVDEPVEYGSGPKAYRPRNYAGEGFKWEPMTLIEALKESRNIVTLRLHEALGRRSAKRIVGGFDFTYNQPRWILPGEFSDCLGTIDCSPFEMAAAYQALANLGMGVRPQFFTNIMGSDGHLIIPRKQHEVQVVSPVAAYQTQYLLRQVLMDSGGYDLAGTGYSAVGKRFNKTSYPPICGKTGTTNDDVDAWFCGFTPDLVIVCQVGFNPRVSLGPKMTGGRVAGPVWAAAFENIMKIPGRKWHSRFDAPSDGIEFANICAKTGKRQSRICDENGHQIYLNVPFAKGKAPKESCDGGAKSPLIPPVSAGVTVAHAPSGGPSEGDSDVSTEE